MQYLHVTVDFQKAHLSFLMVFSLTGTSEGEGDFAVTPEFTMVTALAEPATSTFLRIVVTKTRQPPTQPDRGQEGRARILFSPSEPGSVYNPRPGGGHVLFAELNFGHFPLFLLIHVIFPLKQFSHQPRRASFPKGRDTLPAMETLQVRDGQVQGLRCAPGDIRDSYSSRGPKLGSLRESKW